MATPYHLPKKRGVQKSTPKISLFWEDPNFGGLSQYCIIYKKFRIIKVYRKCSWIVRYIGAYRMNRIVSVNPTYCTIHRHMGLKWFFLLKFVVLFDLNKLLDFVNTKLLGNLIESNEIASPWVFFLPSLSPTKFRLYS